MALKHPMTGGRTPQPENPLRLINAMKHPMAGGPVLQPENQLSLINVNTRQRT